MAENVRARTYISDQLLRHDEVAARQPVETQQQPATQLLIQGMMAITHGGLRLLADLIQEQYVQTEAADFPLANLWPRLHSAGATSTHVPAS